MCILSSGITLVMCIALGARAEVQSREFTCESQIVNSTNDNNQTITINDLFGKCYSPWTEWSKCNKFCIQIRKRKCKNSTMCGTSRLKEKRKCKRKKGACLSVVKIHGGTEKNNKVVDVLYDLFYHPWTPWKSCNKRCIRKRRRLCMKPPLCKGGYLEEERKCSSSVGMCHKSVSIHHKKGQKGKTSGSNKLVPSDTDCGMRPSASLRSLRIVGGREAFPHSWPWQAEILIKKNKHFCGGTLIHPKWILTAAHCIPKKKKRRRVRVRLGEHHIKHIEGTEIETGVEEFHPYPKFDYQTVLHDIALIKLKKEIPMTNSTGIACLPTKGLSVNKKTLCTTIGWGRTSITSLKGSLTLQEVQIPIVRKKKCQKAFSFTINKSQICAGYKKGRKDACVGDSGGPLLCPFTTGDGSERWYVTGVTSYGEGCGQKGKYGLYTNVSKYLKWIKRTIGS